MEYIVKTVLKKSEIICLAKKCGVEETEQLPQLTIDQIRDKIRAKKPDVIVKGIKYWKFNI